MANIIKTINLNNLEHNIKHIKSQNENVCAVVKANAYGHGIKNIVPHINDFVSYFAVNSMEEAKCVRKFSKKPILVLCGFEQKDITYAINNNIEFVVFCKNQLLTLQKYARKHKKTINIHVKFNTGMNRLGFCPTQNDINELKTLLKSENRVKLCGICTHFGGGNNERVSSQAQKFENIISQFPSSITNHSKSSSYIKNKKLSENEMLRTGLLIYGYGDKNVKPILTIKAKIIFIGKALKGDYIGYGTNFKINKDITYAVLGIGYYDGLPRCYAKNGYVLIDGKKAKICGNICMNMTIVDITKINTKVGDYATILNEELNADIIANSCGTISYEILTNFK